MAAARDRLPPFPLADAPAPAGAGALDRLRARVRALEGGGLLSGDRLKLGIAAIDRRLGDGLARAALHEIVAGDGAAGAATGFTALLLARALADRAGQVLWCCRRSVIDSGEIYGPGLVRFGLDPERLIVIRARRNAEVLWAMEEGLRCRALVAVAGEADRITLTESRRLQLAAETGGATALLLRPAGDGRTPTAAVTCWRLSSAPSRPGGPGGMDDAPGAECWQAELLRRRGGTPDRWLVEWRDETRDLALSAPVRDRPAEARRAAAR